MNILLSGITGFLGSHLSRGLLNEKHCVIGLKRSFSDMVKIADIARDIELYDIDRGGIESAYRAHKVDVVIHTATAYGHNNAGMAAINEANVHFPLQLMDRAMAGGCKAFINTDTFFNTEKSSYGYLNSYILSKKHFKEWLQGVSSSTDMRLINMRLQHVFGPADNNNKFVPWIMQQLLENVESIDLTPGEQQRDFIFVDDVVSAYLTVLNHLDDLEGYWQSDIGTGQAITLRKFIESCWQVCKNKYRPDLNTKLGFGKVPYRKNEFFNIEENTDPLRLLGWKAVTRLEKGIENTLKSLV